MSSESWVSALRQQADTSQMTSVFPWHEVMASCPHDPIHHAEGSPWIHTAMVAEAMQEDASFRKADPYRQTILLAASWAHDIGKPATTILEEENGITRVRQPGHAALGARMVWQDLLDRGEDIDFARDVHALVSWHMRPTHLHKENDQKIFEKVIRFSVEAGGGGWDELMALCRSDQNGRVSLDPDRDKMLPLDLLDLELDQISEREGFDIRTSPWPFGSDAARLKLLRGGRSTHYTPQDPEGARVILMTGLPGSGKDSWIAEHHPDLPVVSLDNIRSELKIPPEKDQGPVIQVGFERAKAHLRKGEDFIWNATNIGRFGRQKILGLCLDYDAHVSFVSLDIPLEEVLRRNAQRDAAVPEAVIRKLALKREPVMADEAHKLISVDQNGVCRPVFGKDFDLKPISEEISL